MSGQHSMVILWAIIAIIQMASSASIDQPSSTSSPSGGLFAADLLGQIVKPTKNIIFSPASIQTAFAMTYLGAAGKTAEELKNGLRLPSSDKDKVGEYFAQILNKKSGEATLSIANRMFVNSDYQLQPDFNRRAENYFHSEAEPLNFKNKPLEAIETINNWVENKTNNKIKKLMPAGSVDSDTAAVIVNAIYFKGKWAKPFSTGSTSKRPFWISNNASVQTDTMYGSNFYLKYGEFADLGATAIEMPYKNSDISMMVILPSEKEGLAKLESKLSSMDINELSSKMSNRKVDIMLPKFKIEFSLGLTSVLKKMGIHSIFEDAELPGIFQSGPPVRVSDAQHKAYIEVNEAGSEAAGATFLTITAMSMDFNLKYFNVDRPFFFAIKDSKAVYFVGHVVKF